jgi:glycosyltransferase involved in cell wall biosynthesis
METITAVIITCNEERNIGRCLESLKGVADRVVVVDSGSTDATADICQQHGAKFLSHVWEGYSLQKNFANSLVTDGWILSLDADEALSDTLRNNLMNLKKQGLDVGAVYALRRLNNCCGQWIRHSGWSPDIKVRLWPAGTASWDGVVHEELRFTGTPRTIILSGELLHYSYYSIAELADRQVAYARLAAQKAHERGRHCSLLGIWLRPGWTFIRNYLLRGGFRDGKMGYIVCRMSAFYTFTKYAELLMKNEE